MKISSFKFLLPGFCFNTVVQGVVYRQETRDQIINNDVVSFPKHLFKGIFPINNFGWFIRQKSDAPLISIAFHRVCRSVQYRAQHPTFSFEIFKVNIGNEGLMNQQIVLQNLATSEDLKNSGGWVINLALIGDPLSKEGTISEELHGYSKPLASISKVVNRKENKLILYPGDSLEEVYQEIWPILSEKIQNACWKKLNDIDELLENKKIGLLNLKIKEIDTERENYTQKINQYTQLFNDAVLLSQDISLEVIEKWVQKKKEEFYNNLQIKLKEVEDTQNTVWGLRSTNLNKQKQYILNQINEIRNLYFFKNSSNHKIEEYVKNYIYIFLNGVGDKEDKGGLVLTPFKNSQKVVGIMQEAGFALDLTLDEVQDWIFKSIQEYYDKEKEIVDQIIEIPTPVHTPKIDVEEDCTDPVRVNRKRAGEDLGSINFKKPHSPVKVKKDNSIVFGPSFNMSDEVWDKIERFIPKKEKKHSNRPFVNHIFGFLKSRLQWNQFFPKAKRNKYIGGFGSWKRLGVWELILGQLKEDSEYYFLVENSCNLKKEGGNFCALNKRGI